MTILLLPTGWALFMRAHHLLAVTEWGQEGFQHPNTKILPILTPKIPPLEVNSLMLSCIILLDPLFFFFGLFFFLKAAPAAYGGSQARGRIGAVAASLHCSHSNARSKPHLRPTPQLRATPDP